MFRLSFVLLFILILSSSFALALGINHEPGDLPPRTSWPTGLYEAVNTPERVHGYWVNSSDKLFYEGDHIKLNQMIDKLASVPGVETEVVLHAGPGTAKTAYSLKSVGPADWSVTIGGVLGKGKNAFERIRFDIWLGRSLDLENLKIPPSFTVTSGDEIEAFIHKHKSPKRED